MMKVLFASWRQPLIRLRRRSWRERLLLVEALIWLAVARAAILSVPFRHLAPLLGSARSDPARDLPPGEAAYALQIGWSVRAAARRTPWDSNCLAQAIAAKMMLRRQGIPSTLYLGVVRPVHADALGAHAWLRCGSHILTGERGHGRYAVVASFTDRRS